jgi:hypothetical protein
MAVSRPPQTNTSRLGSAAAQLTSAQRNAVKQRSGSTRVYKSNLDLSGGTRGYKHGGVTWKSHQQRTAVLKQLGKFTSVKANRQTRKTYSPYSKNNNRPSGTSRASGTSLSRSFEPKSYAPKRVGHVGGYEFTAMANYVESLSQRVGDTTTMVNIVERQHQIMEARIFENSGSAPEFGVFNQWAALSPITMSGGAFTVNGKLVSIPPRGNQVPRPLIDTGALREAAINPQVERFRSQLGETATFTINPSLYGSKTNFNYAKLQNEGSVAGGFNSPFEVPKREFLPEPTPEFMAICDIAITKYINDPKSWDKISRSMPGAKKKFSAPEMSPARPSKRNAEYLQRKYVKKNAQRKIARLEAKKLQTKSKTVQKEEAAMAKRSEAFASEESKMQSTQRFGSYMRGQGSFENTGLKKSEAIRMGIHDPHTGNWASDEQLLSSVSHAATIRASAVKALSAGGKKPTDQQIRSHINQFYGEAKANQVDEILSHFKRFSQMEKARAADLRIKDK